MILIVNKEAKPSLKGGADGATKEQLYPDPSLRRMIIIIIRKIIKLFNATENEQNAK